MIVLMVMVGRVEADVEASLVKRFGKFYDPMTRQVDYPTSCDSHAFDVFNDEFATSTEARPVDFAAVVDLPYDYDEFVPFSEDEVGTELAQLDGEGNWIVA